MRRNLLAFFLLIPITLTAQTGKVDSLKLLLKDAGSSKTRVDLASTIARELANTDSAEGTRFADMAIKLSQDLNYQEGITKGHFAKAWIIMRSGYYNLALDLFKENLKEASDINYLEGMGNAHNGLGATYWYLGEYENAKESYFKARKIWETLGDKNKLSRNFFNVALLYQYIGEFEKALDLHNQSLQILDSLEDEPGKAKVYNNLGLIYSRKGNMAESLKNYLKSLEINKEYNDEWGLASDYNNIAILYNRQKKFEQALEYYFLSLELKEKTGNKLRIANTLANIGAVYTELNELDKALSFNTQALNIRQELNSKRDISDSYSNLGVIKLKQKKYDESIGYYLKTIAIDQEVGNKAGLAQSFINMAMAYLSKRDFKEAEKYCLEAKQLAEIHGYHSLEIECNRFLSDLYEQSNKLTKALHHFKIYKALEDSIQSNTSLQRLGLLEAELKFRNERDSLALIQERERIVYEAELERKDYLQTVTIIILVISIIAGLLVYSQYKLKIKSNQQLQKLNQEITNQNQKISKQHQELSETINELKQTQNQLIRSEKMASLGVLVAGLGHEINNPLNYIKGGVWQLSNTIKNKDADFATLEENLVLVDHGVDRIAKIINSLTNFNWQEANQVENCKIHEIINNCLVILEPRLKHRISIEKNFIKHLPDVYANNSSLHQVFLNILSNAEQAIDGKGLITISTSLDHDDVIVSIKDDGEGISEGNLSRVGDPFFTTKDPGVGTGLGVYIANDLITAQKGSISYESVLGTGTTVTISIPYKGTEFIP